ncbi:MAG: hypothetical protein QM581_00030, partial [Pseudomonas sp.]
MMLKTPSHSMLAALLTLASGHAFADAPAQKDANTQCAPPPGDKGPPPKDAGSQDRPPPPGDGKGPPPCPPPDGKG